MKMTIEEQRKLSMKRAENLEERDWTPEEEKYYAELNQKWVDEFRKKNGLKG